MVDEILEVGIDLLASVRGPDELVGGIKHEGELVHLCLVEGVSDGVDVGSIYPDMAGDAAQPLPSVLSAHILAPCHPLLRQLLCCSWLRLGCHLLLFFLLLLKGQYSMLLPMISAFLI